MSTILIRLILFALSFINTIDTYRIRRDIDFVERIQPESYSSAIDDQCQLPSTVLVHLSHLSCDCVTDDDDDDDDGSFNICNKENSMKLRLCAQKVRTYVSNAVGGQWAAIIFSSSNGISYSFPITFYILEAIIHFVNNCFSLDCMH